jgi:hypothetical protein
MKRNPTAPSTKLIEKFDHQLRDLLMTDLEAIRKARMKLINHLTMNNTKERLLTA